MKKIVGIILAIIILISCENILKKKEKPIANTGYQEINTDLYQLIKPTENLKKVLILFPGYLHKAEDTKKEFKILKYTEESNLAVIFMNYNQKLWLEENEKIALAEQLKNIFTENNLPTNDVYIGGYSSGGNVSLLISSYLNQQKRFQLAPKGVFIVDSPIDLLALYKSSQKYLERKFSEVSVAEST